MIINFIRLILIMESEKNLLGPEFRNNDDKLMQSLKSTVKSAFVGRFTEGNERPYDNNDFLEIKKNCEKLISDIKLSLENFINNHSNNNNMNEENDANHYYPVVDNEFLALIIILCGQNNLPQAWNTDITVKNCKIILSQILQLFNCLDVSQLISWKHKINLTKNIFQILCADLTVATWKHFPASVVCYKWILEKISQPDLSQYLQFVLPPALLLVDDFVTSNRIIGAQCLNHIVQNITIAELQLCGYGEVIYSALIPLLRIREADLIDSIIVPLVTVTTKLEFVLAQKDPTKWSKFDSILEIFLENMELEQMINLRNCYIINLNLLINAAGYNIVRWSKRLLRIFDEYIQTAGKFNDEKTTNHCVKAIENYIKFSRDVSFIHARHLLFTLVMALHSTIKYNSEVQYESKEIIINCIKTLLQSFSQVEKENLKVEFQKNLSCNENLFTFYKQINDVL